MRQLGRRILSQKVAKVAKGDGFFGNLQRNEIKQKLPSPYCQKSPSPLAATIQQPNEPKERNLIIMESRYKETETLGILGIIGNIFLLLLKGIVGIITNSQAMIADAINSAGDIFASLMTFIGNKISSKPQDTDHNFGHGKAEYIFSMIISFSMIIAAITLFINAIKTLIYGDNVTFSWLLIIICLVTIITKLALYIYSKIIYKKHNNILVLANMNDHRNDCIVTTFTLISSILILFDITWFDAITCMGITVWILYTGCEIFLESYNVLMDKSIDFESEHKIRQMITNYPEIKRIENLSSSPLGYDYLIVITIAIDGNISTFESHKIADRLEQDILNLENIHTVHIHIHPV